MNNFDQSRDSKEGSKIPSYPIKTGLANAPKGGRSKDNMRGQPDMPVAKQINSRANVKSRY